MATIRVCDSCKKKIETRSDLSSLVIGDSETFEVCESCEELLLCTLRSIDKTIFEAHKFTSAALSMEIKEMSEKQVVEILKSQPQSISVKSDDEPLFIPSNLDRAKAAEAEKELGLRGCPHTFKTVVDGKLICSDAPKDAKGGLSSIKGCGENVFYQTNNSTRHFEMK